ncbi:amidohydrolase [Streptomyces sp. DH-12]|uniref:Atu4866 domain-containing protein n=1 Tax=Streptomyces sp. DH-12 TaxID=2072509 RepID=UPI000CCF272A|nr:Atu4866 domain-containing protein [Streptomyces sp. DH-12]PNV31192.1 amidohydrolase [Streptomyces sp. DH-12]
MTTTAPAPATWNRKALDDILADDAHDGGGRPVLFTNARVMTLDPLIGTMTGADLLVVGPLIVGVGPGIVTAAEDDNAIVVDCTGTTVVPAVVDTVALAGGRGARSEHVATLVPGNTADFLAVPDELADDVPNAVAALLSRRAQVRALVAAGRPVLWSGADVPGRAAVPRAGVPAAPDLTGSPRLGVWIDRNDFLHQELTADGRYDETRGGRPHAYQGRFWIDGDRIDYLDDLGFWAYGEFRGDELHHAGYVMKRG